MANNIYKDCFDSGFNKILDLSSVEIAALGTTYYFEIDPIEESKLIEILDGLTFAKINFLGMVYSIPVVYGLTTTGHPSITAVVYSLAVGMLKCKGTYDPTTYKFSIEATQI